MRFRRLRLLSILVLLAPLACAPDEQKLAEHLERAESYSEEGKHSEAVIEYKGVLQIDPNHAGAHYGLAKAYLSSQKAREGYWELRETVRLDPANLEARLQFGQLSVFAGELEEALAQGEAVAAADPERVNAHLLTAEALEALKRADEAQVSYERAVELDPENRPALLLLANFLRRQGKREAAEPVFAKLAEAHPSFASWSAMGSFFAQDKGRDEEAEKAYRTALEFAEEDQRARGFAMLAGFFFSRNRFEESVGILEDGIERQEDPLDLIYLLARFYRARGEDAKADALVERATEARPDQARPYLILSAYRGRKGDLDGALEAAEQALAIEPDDAKAKLRVAEVLVEIGYKRRSDDNDLSQTRIARGRAIVLAILAGEPSHPGALFVKSKIDLAERNVDDAVASLRQAIDARPEWAQAHFVLGTALALQGDRTAARIELARALEIDAGLLEARRVLAQVHAALGEHEYAIEEARRYLRERPDSKPTRILIAQSLVRIGRLPEALAEIEAIEDADGNPEVLFARGRIKMGMRDTVGAREDLLAAHQLVPSNPEILLTLFDLDGREGRIAESVERIFSASKARPDDARLQQLKALASLASGDTKGAEASFQRAIDLDPENLGAYEQLARYFARVGRLQEAIDTTEKALARRPNAAKLHHFAGVLYEYGDRRVEAIQHYETALGADPNLAEAKNNLAYLLAESGEDLDRALDLAQEAKSLLPDNANAADTLGWVLYKRGIPSAAISYLREAEAGMDPASSSLGLVQHHLALAYHANGDSDEATATLERALAGFDSDSDPPPWVTEARTLLDSLQDESADG